MQHVSRAQPLVFLRGQPIDLPRRPLGGDDGVPAPFGDSLRDFAISDRPLGNPGQNTDFLISLAAFVQGFEILYIVPIRKAVSYWEIRSKEAFSSPGFVIVIC